MQVRFVVRCTQVAHADANAGRQMWSTAEGLYLRAKRPDLALAMYRNNQLWDDALRVAEDFLPAKVCLCGWCIPM